MRLVRVRMALGLLAALAALAPAARAQNGEPPPAPNLRIDDRPSDHPLTVNLFDRPVMLRLGYELTREQRRDFDLNAARDRDRRTRDQELTLDARMVVTPQVMVMLQASGISEVRKQPATGVRTRVEGWQRGETWLRWEGIAGTPLGLQVGRLPLVDRRTFWWDEDLDAVRLFARGERWYVEGGLARELAKTASFARGIALRDRGVRRWFGQARWEHRPRHALEAFAMHADDRSGIPAPGAVLASGDVDGSDARLSWLGLRASGADRLASGHRYGYWADLAAVSGVETITVFRAGSGGSSVASGSARRRVRGQAIDLGAQWSLALALRPTLTLGWAQGSGAPLGAEVDRNFRQTGLQENKARLSGVKRLQRYGEVLDPQLANLRVATLSFGLRLLPDTSIELAAHHFRQRVASPLVADTRLSQAPAGTDPRLGREVDLMLAWRESRHVELTLLLGRFWPGPAFAADRRDPAISIELGLALNY